MKVFSLEWLWWRRSWARVWSFLLIFEPADKWAETYPAALQEAAQGPLSRSLWTSIAPSSFWRTQLALLLLWAADGCCDVSVCTLPASPDPAVFPKGWWFLKARRIASSFFYFQHTECICVSSMFHMFRLCPPCQCRFINRMVKWKEKSPGQKRKNLGSVPILWPWESCLIFLSLSFLVQAKKEICKSRKFMNGLQDIHGILEIRYRMCVCVRCIFMEEIMNFHYILRGIGDLR